MRSHQRKDSQEVIPIATHNKILQDQLSYFLGHRLRKPDGVRPESIKRADLSKDLSTQRPGISEFVIGRPSFSSSSSPFFSSASSLLGFQKKGIDEEEREVRERVGEASKNSGYLEIMPLGMREDRHCPSSFFFSLSLALALAPSRSL